MDKSETQHKPKRNYQPLRGHLVRLLPGPADLASRCPIVLTERDRLLLAAVHQLGFLTADHIALAFFPGRDGAGSAAHQRVRELWQWGYLDRVQRPVAPAIGGSRPLLHALGPAGVPVVAAQLGDGTSPVQRRRLDRLDDLFVNHDLQAAALWANVAAEVRGTLVRSWRWIAERELRARGERVRDERSRHWLPFLPDAAVELTYAEGDVQVCLVEIDMGTQPLRRFRRKARAFELFLESGQFARRWGRDTFEVVVLTSSRPRLEQLWRACREDVPERRWSMYSLATFDVLRPAQWREGSGFLTLDNQWVGLLYDAAYPSDSCAASDPTHPTGDPGA